jgi:multidrug efflux pump
VFWGPLAYAMMGGILVATLLTIFVLPAGYALFFGRVAKQPKQSPEDTAAHAAAANSDGSGPREIPAAAE